MTFEKKFSYWLLAWFFVFYFGFTVYNPSLLLIVALSYNIIMIFYMLRLGMFQKIKTYASIAFLIKVLPLLVLLYKNQITFNRESTIFSMILAFIYLLYMRITNTSISDAYDIHKNNNTPLSNYIKQNMK
jgi:hypothetical protein